MKTLKNKLYAVVLLICGYLPVLIDKDATALVFFAFIAIPLFFAKENWIYLGLSRQQRLFSFRQNYNSYCGKRYYLKGVKGAWTK